MVELKIGELKALIRDYNKTMQKEEHITPAQLKGKSKNEILKVNSDLGYTVNHEKRLMKRTNKDKKKPLVIKLPPPKTEEEKKTAKEERGKKKAEKDKKKQENLNGRNR